MTCPACIAEPARGCYKGGRPHWRGARTVLWLNRELEGGRTVSAACLRHSEHGQRALKWLRGSGLVLPGSGSLTSLAMVPALWEAGSEWAGWSRISMGEGWALSQEWQPWYCWRRCPKRWILWQVSRCVLLGCPMYDWLKWAWSYEHDHPPRNQLSQEFYHEMTADEFSFPGGVWSLISISKDQDLHWIVSPMFSYALNCLNFFTICILKYINHWYCSTYLYIIFKPCFMLLPVHLDQTVRKAESTRPKQAGNLWCGCTGKNICLSKCLYNHSCRGCQMTDVCVVLHTAAHQWYLGCWGLNRERAPGLQGS